MKVAISQPAYLPWSGYFDLIDQVDTFALLDCVQFEKQSWQQRNRIKTPMGLQWLTVPVIFRGRFGQLIHEVEIRDGDFARKHLRSVELNYRRAPFFQQYFPQLQCTLHSHSNSTLLDLNEALIRWFCQILGIQTEIVRSSNLNGNGKRSRLLVSICTLLGADAYLSPLGSADYLTEDLDLFTAEAIEVQFQHFEHPQYSQLFPPFQSHASVLDLIFNEGPASLSIIRSGRRPAFTPSEVASLAGSAEAT